MKTEQTTLEFDFGCSPAMMTLADDKIRHQPTCSQGVKPLSDSVSVNQRQYRLIQRKGNVAIYSAPVSNEKPDVTMYEVVIIRVAPEKTFPNGIHYPAREFYPSPDDWGTYGWTYTPNSHREPLESAKRKLVEVSKRLNGQHIKS